MDDRLPFSGLPPSDLPMLEELGLSLDRIVGQPFGRDEAGQHIGGDSGPTFGVLRALREAVAQRAEMELPLDMPPKERQRRLTGAQEAALDQLIAMVNAAQPDPRYQLTKDYLQDSHNRFSYELWTFVAEFARIISGDRELIYRSGTYAIPPAVARLARPFGVQGTYRAVGRLALLVVRSDLTTVATSQTSATVRWPGAQVPELVPESHVPHYLALGCQAFRGALAAIPREVGRMEQLAEVVEHQCRARGADYCEWEFRWQAPSTETSVRRYVVVPALLSAGAAAAVMLRLPGGRLLGALAAAALPLVAGAQRRRIRQLAAERDREHELLLEQRELSEIEFGNRSKAYMEIQQSNLELEHRVAELTALNEVGRATAGGVELEALLDASLAAIVKHGRYQRALVLLHDAERNVLTAGRSVGGSAKEQAALARYEVDLRREGSLLARTFHSDEPLLVMDLEEMADGPGRAFAAAIGATSFLGTPLVSRGRKLGVLAVDHGRRGRVPDEADKGLLFTIGSLIASALERAQLYAEIERHNRELEDRVNQRTQELARASEEAEVARRQAEAANEAKGRFLSNVSHELRTPLTSVLGFAKIIGKRLDQVILPAVDMSDPKRERAVKQVRDNISIIVAEGERLTSMINNVLDLAKIESGRFEWKDEEIALPELLRHAASATASLFTDKGLELRTTLADDLPSVRGDHDRLLQVVINLLSNAVKFTDSGHVELRAMSEAGEVHVSVTDTGVGIAPEDYATVFEQFRQVGDTLTDKPHGTGLGLPISKEIIEHHGGRLWLDSKPGKGSTFYFSLPIKSAEVRPASAKPAAARRRAKSASDGAAPLVLVADDDDSTRELLRQELEARDYRVVEAVDGRSALTAVRDATPDLIVLDVIMPEPDGFDVAATLKADPQTAAIPILMLTVLDAPDRAQRSGVEAYVTKPFATEQLMEHVVRLCPPAEATSP